jgi:hypothetical protein
MPKVTHAEVRMYRMGTGDCLAVKFFAGQQTVFRIMIDGGAWYGSQSRLEPYILDLKQYLEDYADVLLVTHEHNDHVLAFEACAHLFTDGKFQVGEIWLGWTEDDHNRKVQEWKGKYGEKKKALGLAAEKLAEVTAGVAYKKQFAGSLNARQALSARQAFASVLNGFAGQHLSLQDQQHYLGGLAGMEVVKNKIVRKDIKYFKPGDVVSDFGEAQGLKIYVLGPPELYGDLKKKAGDREDAYDHNQLLLERDAFGAAVLQLDNPEGGQDSLLPFDEHYLAPAGSTLQKEYNKADWRKIDYDWLYSAGPFALRMNSLTNNLSLAIAIEFEESGKVLLFPGDAEFGSWASWHRIPWHEKKKENPENREKMAQKHLTEDLLNRTVFYKVAHHLSHNGTARKLGLDMMHHQDLAAMATLDYEVIHAGWTTTMPNRDLVKELLARTKGRLMVMNEEHLFLDFNKEVSLKDKLAEARSRMSGREKQAFEENLKQTALYIQYRVNV